MRERLLGLLRELRVATMEELIMAARGQGVVRELEKMNDEGLVILFRDHIGPEYKGAMIR